MSEEKRVAVVTGSGRGIGKGIAEQLAKDGYSLVIADFDATTAAATAAELKDNGFDAVSVAGDVSDPEAHKAFVQAAVDNFGRLDTYVNNAGIAQIKMLQDETPEDMQKIFSVNVFVTGFRQLPHNSKNKTTVTRFGRLSTPPVLPATWPLTSWVPTPQPSLPFGA